MYLGNNAALLGCQEYFNRCAAAGSPIGATQTPSSYDNAASFNGTNQFLSIASNSTLTVTGSSFTFAFWANTPNTSNGMVISKSDGNNAREFQIVLNTGGSLGFAVFPDGTFANRKDLNSGASAFIANTWNFFVCRYDSSGGGTMGISINGQAFNSLGSVGAITQTNTNTLTLGCFINTASGLNYNGRLASVGFWKRALSASEVTALFNTGAGRTYASLDSGLRTNLISWWALNQNSVTADSHTTGNNLTNNGTPLVTATTLGPIVTSLADPRQLIVDFAQGIDQLGLWNSMVCWPLRSSQNAQSTQTAFSLGGGGTFNAALIGNPAWTSTGIAGAGSPSAGGQYVSTTYAMPASPVSYYAAIMPTPTSIGTNALYYSTSGINVSGRQFVLQSSGVQNIDWMMGYNGNWPPSSRSFEITRGPSNYNVYASSKFASWRIQDSSTVFVSLNNSQTSGAITGWDSSSPAGVLNIVALSRAPVAFSCIFNTFVSNSLDSQVSALYKQTLGLGLGLP
jgi:hypothetical protein